MKDAKWKIKGGITLMIISIPLFLIAFLIPFLEFETNVKVTSATVFFVLAEVTFWGGGLLVGKELFVKYKSYFNPKNWFKKKTESIEESQEMDNAKPEL